MYDLSKKEHTFVVDKKYHKWWDVTNKMLEENLPRFQSTMGPFDNAYKYYNKPSKGDCPMEVWRSRFPESTIYTPHFKETIDHILYSRETCHVL